VKLWNAKSGADLVTLKHGDVVTSAVFSPDGKRVISGCRDRTIRVWDTATGVELLTLRAGFGVLDVAFSQDGRTIASGLFDHTIALWESTIPPAGYERRRNGETARKIVKELHEQHGLYSGIIDKLKADQTLKEPVRKVALQIANSRLWEDEEKTEIIKDN
jgi:WD40 repeat protein